MILALGSSEVEWLEAYKGSRDSLDSNSTYASNKTLCDLGQIT